MNNIIKRFKLNKNMTTEMSNYLHKTGKCVESAKRHFIMCFDDEMDYLAFCNSIGIIKISKITEFQKDGVTL